MYGAMERVEDPSETCADRGLRTKLLDNVKPSVEVRSRRVGGATYQVPVEVRPERREALAMRWMIDACRASGMRTRWKSGSPANSVDAASSRGTAVKKREDTHKMADANKAFSHYRW